MSWREITPSRDQDGGKKFPVSIRASGKGKRFRPSVLLIVRAALLEGLAWWQPQGRVSVALGEGEHASLLRVTPSGPFKLRGSPAKGSDGTAMLRLFDLPVMPTEKHKLEELQHEWREGLLQVTLPAWLRADRKAAAPAKSNSSPNDPPMRLADVKIDPVALGRRGVGPVPSSKPAAARK